MAKDLFSGEMVAKNFALSSSMGDDPMIWTPSAVKAELGRILTLVDTVNLEVSQAVGDKKATPAEWKSWSQFYETAHKYLTRASSLWGSNVIVARTYEREANKWRKLLEARGVKPVGPEDQGRGGDSEPFFTPLRIGLVLGGVTASALLINAIKK